MAAVRFTNRARDDLLELWAYLAEHAGMATADRAFDVIESRCSSLSENPRLGPARPEIAPDARSLIADRWVALYRIAGGAIEIVRVLDGARDLTAVVWREER